MSETIPVRQIVVSPSGAEYDSPGAIARHRYQTSIGRARTRLSIKRDSEPLRPSPHTENTK